MSLVPVPQTIGASSPTSSTTARSSADVLVVVEGRRLAGRSRRRRGRASRSRAGSGRGSRAAASSTAPASSNGVAIAVSTPRSSVIAISVPASEQLLEADREAARAASPTSRTASSTPGMNERRSIESWRTLSVCPSPPKMTSWWATRPGSRTEWIGSWTLPPASRISSAVRFAVPDGASSFLSWWSSTISHSGMCGAIRCATSISSTAPIAKLGATKQLALAARRSAASRSSSRSKPVVPTTAWTPASRQARTLAERGLGGGEVDDDVGAVEHVRRARRRARDRPGRRAPCPRRPRPPRRRPGPSARRRRRRRPGSCRRPGSR